jgi:NAD(P)-dependent dehydrogenase (short-subunit alcohol dehydrogenase family)
MHNNAGGVGDPAGITDITSSSFDAVIKLDVNSVLYGHKYAARQFKKQGTGGTIITTASTAALQGGWSSVSYTVAKHALIGLIRHAALELGSSGIRTNAIAPGVTLTPIFSKGFGIPMDDIGNVLQQIDQEIGSTQPMCRFGTVEDTANAALYLASDLSSYVTGIIIPVDGGLTSYTSSRQQEDITAIVKKISQP